MRKFVALAFFFVAAAGLAADRAEDLARIHLEALGGRERVDALAAVRATGHVIAGGKRVDFYMIAARPAKLRLEIDGGGRTQVQAYDGVEPPWEFDTGTWPPRYKTMAENSAKTFMGDAEFDDPLVSGASRGYTLEYGGMVEGDGKQYVRVMVTRRLKETFSLLLDQDTYLIMMRVESRMTLAGRPIQIVTRFDDYRPVDGVLLAHKVTMIVDGVATQQSVIESIQSNPTFTPETFSRPKSGGK